ncbi:MAG: hypothetical protein HYY20_06410 [Candidatus Tectomicrobia bacterium]|uniref:Uncharacterized protein n=1 Tax=Tectimicrobiota bacterium TaxID=2528274 RepID=A0A932CNU2_UNCTE|nr:hypothetical protein [Candidatus Tectomicrobia bacterium]
MRRRPADIVWASLVLLGLLCNTAVYEKECLQAWGKSEARSLGGVASESPGISKADSPSKTSLPEAVQHALRCGCICHRAFASPTLLVFSPITLPVPWSSPVDLPWRDVLSHPPFHPPRVLLS